MATDDRVESLLRRSRAVLSRIEGIQLVAGLQQRVSVLRDQWGIAHIYAENSRDLFFAQGFCMAQDRLFQVDLWRRVARGETAELFGEESIAADRFARLFRYRGDMNDEWTSYSPDTREIAEAFTAGINAWIDEIGDRLPIEFQLAGYRPSHWQPEDILGRMSGMVMSGNWEKEVARARLIQAVGVERAHLLAPTDPVRPFAFAPGLNSDVIRSEILDGLRAAMRVLRFTPSTSESNNWVVSGMRSASGKPLLASDPHRAITLPSLRYMVHLNAPGWDVIGSGEPALPGVALGHNARIAWGFTIVGTDQADLFVEQTHPEDPRRYRAGDHWEAMTVVREEISVRGRPEPLVLELRFTRHGPVVWQDEKRHVAVALKWAGSEPGGAAYLASLALDRASNREEFLNALCRWKVPGLNFVYADVDGEFGWVAAAATPVRRTGDGLLPVPGQTDAFEWDRFLSVSELPQSFSPPCGWLATANQNIVPPNYSHQIAFDWAAPWRFRRIEEILNQPQSWTSEDFRRLQHDSVSLPAVALQTVLRQVTLPDELQAPGDLISTWDCDLSTSAAAGALYAVWMQELSTAMYGLHPDLPEFPERGDLRSAFVVLQHLANPSEAWFGASAVARRNDLLVRTLKTAVGRTRTLLGEDSSQWSWGRLHQATFRHPMEGLIPEIAEAFNVGPFPRSGDANTVLNTRHNPEFQQIHGATYRHILDIGDWDRAVATSAPGQSGQPGSPHYADLAALWAKGEYFPLAWSRAAVETVTKHRLTLLPQGQP